MIWLNTWGPTPGGTGLAMKTLTFLLQTASSSEYLSWIWGISGISGWSEGELIRSSSRLSLSVAASRAWEAVWILSICSWSLSSLYCARRLRVMGVPPSSWTWSGFGTSILAGWGSLNWLMQGKIVWGLIWSCSEVEGGKIELVGWTEARLGKILAVRLGSLRALVDYLVTETGAWRFGLIFSEGERWGFS